MKLFYICLNCPFCQKNNFSTVYLLKNKKILRCKNDGLFLAEEITGNKTVLYNKKYYDINPHPALIKTNRQYFLEKIKTIRQLTGKQNPKILDIGCGWGDFLTVVKQSGLGYLGVDESNAAIEICRSKGLNCKKHPSGRFSAITCFQVIEHIKNPLSFLKNCRKMLKKNGVILITTPNNDSPERKKAGSNWSVYNTDSHFVFYNKKNLAGLLIKAGFKNVKVETDEPRYLSFGYLLSRFNELSLNNFFGLLNPFFKIFSFPIKTNINSDIVAIAFK